MSKPKRRRYTVMVDMPADVTVEGMREYIEEAVAMWCKSMPWPDPIFDLDGDTVKVYSRPKKKSGNRKRRTTNFCAMGTHRKP